MTTNYEWLLHMDGEERQAWFDAERVDEPCAFRPEKVHDCMDVDSKSTLEADIERVKDSIGKMHDALFGDTHEKLEAWFDAEHMDAQRDDNGTCPISDETASNGGDSREQLEADVRQYANPSGGTNTLGAYWERTMLEFLDRQAKITRKTEQAAWIQQANGLIHEANVRAEELQAKVDELSELNGYAWQEGFEKGCESRDDAIADWRAETDELREELAKRDKGIERLKRQRDTARMKIDELHAECDTCCYKTDYIEMDFLDVDRLEAERDALAADLQDCEQQRERLRQALGTAIDHAHEIMALVDIEGEVA